MRSALAEQLRAAQRAREAKLTPEGRVRLALRLGERDLRAFASAQGIPLREAWRQLRRAGQDGRVRSGAMDFGEP
jgi:hypothetical protein